MENRIKHILLTVLPFAGLLLVPAAVSAQEDDRPLIEPDVRPQKVDEALIDTENFEIGAFAGIINIEDFESSFLWGGKLTYHLSETFFFEANVALPKAEKPALKSSPGMFRCCRTKTGTTATTTSTLA